MGRGFRGEFQYQVLQREAPMRPELVGTLTISNPVWSLCGQICWGLNTFRSPSRKIKREGRALLEIPSISSTASPQTASLRHFSISLFHPRHSTCLSLSAVVTRPPQKKQNIEAMCAGCQRFSEAKAWEFRMAGCSAIKAAQNSGEILATSALPGDPRRYDRIQRSTADNSN